MNKTTEVDAITAEATEKSPTATGLTLQGYVRVNDWSNRRRMQILPDSVGLEVYRLSCSCPTCLSRAEAVFKTLSEKPDVEHAWVQIDGGLWVALRKRPEQDGLQYMKDTLNLSRLEFSS